MNNFHGGAIKKNPGKNGFTPISDMLDINATLKLLSDDSLYGFILELTVREEDSEYTTIDNQPITNFVLKIVVTSPEKNSILPRYKDKNKLSESVSNFVNEAKIQQGIWLQSVQYGNPEICPDVLDVFFFNYQNSIHLIRLFETVTLDDEIRHRMLQYLNNIFNNPKNVAYGIGLIVMPKIMNSISLDSYLSNYSINNIVYSNIIAQIVRLFIVNGVIHLDLHSNNILINTDNLYCEIIDFGLILQVDSETEMYRSRYQQLNDDITKSNFIKDTVNFIISCETRELSILFPTKKNASALSWLNKYINDPQICLLSFQTLFSLMPLMSPPSPRQKKTKRKARETSTETSPEKSTETRKILKGNSNKDNNMVNNYNFDPSKVNTIIPFIPDTVRDTKITMLKKREQQRKEKEEIEKQRRWIETHPKLSEEEEVNPYECKIDEESGWGCTVMGGKRTSTRKKLIKNKTIKKSHKKMKKHSRKQK
jgi:serine/threonine protein kinase